MPTLSPPPPPQASTGTSSFTPRACPPTPRTSPTPCPRTPSPWPSSGRPTAPPRPRPAPGRRRLPAGTPSRWRGLFARADPSCIIAGVCCTHHPTHCQPLLTYKRPSSQRCIFLENLNDTEGGLPLPTVTALDAAFNLTAIANSEVHHSCRCPYPGPSSSPVSMSPIHLTHPFDPYPPACPPTMRCIPACVPTE